MRKLLLPFLLISVGFVSCKKDKAPDPSALSQGQNFYPTQIGKYILYNYDSTIYDGLLGTAIPLTGQVRYETVDTFRDASNRLSYVINVKSRKNSTDPFVPNDVIYVTPTEDHVEFKQKNITFLKMVFPVSNGKSWNGNAMIPLGDDDYAEYNNDQWKYTYANFDQDFDPGNNLYQHTVTVNEIDDTFNNPDTDPDAYASRNYSQEIYAFGVGLVYKERTYWTFQPKVQGGGGGSGFREGYSIILKAVENN